MECGLGRFVERARALLLSQHVAKVRGDVSPKVTTIPRQCVLCNNGKVTAAVAREPTTQRSRRPRFSCLLATIPREHVCLLLAVLRNVVLICFF